MLDDPSSPLGENAPIEIIIDEAGWHDIGFDIAAFSVQIYHLVMGAFEGEKGVIDLLLTHDLRMRELNKQWRGFDKSTNVLSFPHVVNDEILGDIAISLQYLQSEAKEQQKSFKDHFAHLLIHGILHLLGYDHIVEDEAEEMENLEREFLAKMGINDPYELERGENGH